VLIEILVPDQIEDVPFKVALHIPEIRRRKQHSAGGGREASNDRAGALSS
jgi:hypothetical protein